MKQATTVECHDVLHMPTPTLIESGVAKATTGRQLFSKSERSAEAKRRQRTRSATQKMSFTLIELLGGGKAFRHRFTLIELLGRGKAFRHRFTLIELLVVIVIISVLASLLLPALSRSRDEGRRATCMNNLKQLGVSVHMYADDHDGYLTKHYFDQGVAWFGVLHNERYIAIQENPVGSCPANEYPSYNFWGTKYAHTWSGYTTVWLEARYGPFQRISSIVEPTNETLFTDSAIQSGPKCRYYFTSYGITPAMMGPMSTYHMGRVNAFWLDGHVKGYRFADYQAGWYRWF